MRAAERAELAALHEERDKSTRELAGLTERVNAALATFKELDAAQTDLETKETTATGAASAAAKARGELEEFERQLEERIAAMEKEGYQFPARFGRKDYVSVAVVVRPLLSVAVIRMLCTPAATPS